jgi:hypothetical protein
MLSWQSRLNKEWQFEVVIQEMRSKGRGRGWSHRYYEPEHEKGVWLIKLQLIEKLRAVADELEGEVRSEREAVFSETLDTEGFAEAWKVYQVSTDEAKHSVARVRGLKGTTVTFSIPSEESVHTPTDAGSQVLRSLPLRLPSLEWSPDEESVTTDESILADDEETIETPASPDLFTFGRLRSQAQSDEPVETDSQEGGDEDEFQTFVTDSKESP